LQKWSLNVATQLERITLRESHLKITAGPKLCVVILAVTTHEPLKRVMITESLCKEILVLMTKLLTLDPLSRIMRS
jgi:hypothetical protein